MEPGNLKAVKKQHTMQNPAAASVGELIVKSDELIIAGPIAVRQGRHLDVDEILRHSLPAVVQPIVLRRINK